MRAFVCPLNFVFFSAIEIKFLNQSEPSLHEMFMGTRSRMSLILSKIRPVTLDLLALKIAVFNLVSATKTTFLNQSGPKLHKVFIGTRSRMNLIMS